MDLDTKLPLFEIDTEGTVLWYLSGTMGRTVQENSAVHAPSPAFVEKQFSSLLGRSVVENSQVLGSSLARVADAILIAISSQNTFTVSEGYRAFFTLVLPVPTPFTQQSLDEFLVKVPVTSGSLQKLERLITKGKRVIFLVSGLVLIAVVVKFVVGGSLQRIIEHLRMPTGGDIRSYVQAMFVKLSQAGSSSYFDELKRFLKISNVLVALFSVGAQAALKFYGKDVSKALLASYKGVFSVIRTKAYATEQQRTERVRASLRAEGYDELGRFCGTTPDVLVALLRNDGQSNWSSAALVYTRKATVTVIRQVIHFLRFPEIDDNTRDQVFQWLCRVRVVHSVGSGAAE